MLSPSYLLTSHSSFVIAHARLFTVKTPDVPWSLGPGPDGGLSVSISTGAVWSSAKKGLLSAERRGSQPIQIGTTLWIFWSNLVDFQADSDL